MSDANQVIRRYVEAWNSRDPMRRRAVIDEVWAEGASYVDPLAVVQGREAFDVTIAAVQQQFPDFELRLAGAVDAHHNVARFTWELGPAGGAAVVVGFDVAVLGDDGRLAAVYGFLDRVPAAAG